MNRKLFIIVLTILFVNTMAHAFFTEVINTGFKAVKDSVNAISDAVFKQTMVAQTIQSVAMLKKNYDESVAFYREMKYYQENPNALAEHISNESLKTLNEIRDRAVGTAQAEFTKGYNEPGFWSKTQEAAEKYVYESLSFSKYIVEKQNKENIDEAKQIAMELKDNKKVESGKIHNELLQTKLLLSIEKLLAKNVESTIKLYDYMSRQERINIERDKIWQKEVDLLFKKRKEKDDKKTSQDTLKNFWQRR